jgi:hypothetical protein
MVIKVDTADLERRLRGFEAAIPKAIEIAINRTAKDARMALIGSLGHTFNIRSGWVERGVRVIPARPAALVAVVGSKDPFMERQVTGGTRYKAGSVPTEEVRGPDRKGKTTIGLWPKNLARRRGYFLQQTKGGAALYRRSGNPQPRVRRWGKYTGPVIPRYPIAAVYRFPPGVTIKPRWPMEQIVREVVERTWPRNMIATVDDAIRRAR